MSRTDLNVSVVVGMVDRLTKPIKSAIRPVDTLGKSINATTQRLNKLGSTKTDIQKFTQLKRGSLETAKALKAAEANAAKLGKALKAAEKPTKAMEAAFKNARARVVTSPFVKPRKMGGARSRRCAANCQRRVSQRATFRAINGNWHNQRKSQPLHSEKSNPPLIKSANVRRAWRHRVRR